MDAPPSEDRFLVLGAGPVGLALAKALAAAGVPYQQVEATDHVGGNWAHGVYETAHIISSRRTTEYPDWPMPADYPDFPSAAQMCAYYNAFADHFGLRPGIAFETTVTAIEPADDHRWRVTLRGSRGDERAAVYKGVFVCNGHHWDFELPDWAARYAGELIHSKQYKRPAQLEGKRVLVMGGGNSGCDIASEGGRVGASCDWSLRRGYHFMPKTLFGRPSVELIRGWMPLWLQRLSGRITVALIWGSYARYGLPAPDHRLYEAHPTVNSEVFHYLKHGRIRVKPDVAGVDGDTLRFVDGSEGRYDVVVCATGYRVSFPFLPDGLVPVMGKTAQVVAGGLVPGRKNLFVIGTTQPRYGLGPLVVPFAQLATEWIRLQDELELPLSDVLVALGARPPQHHLTDPHEALRQIKRVRRLTWLIRRKHRAMLRRRAAR